LVWFSPQQQRCRAGTRGWCRSWLVGAGWAAGWGRQLPSPSPVSCRAAGSSRGAGAVPCPVWPRRAAPGSGCPSPHCLCFVSLRRSWGRPAGRPPSSAPRKRCPRRSHSAENDTLPAHRRLTRCPAPTPPAPVLEAAAGATRPSRSALTDKLSSPDHRLPICHMKSKFLFFLVSKVFIKLKVGMAGGPSCSPESCSMSPVVRSPAVNAVACIT